MEKKRMMKNLESEKGIERRRKEGHIEFNSETARENFERILDQPEARQPRMRWDHHCLLLWGYFGIGDRKS